MMNNVFRTVHRNAGRNRSGNGLQFHIARDLLDVSPTLAAG